MNTVHDVNSDERLIEDIRSGRLKREDAAEAVARMLVAWKNDVDTAWAATRASETIHDQDPRARLQVMILPSGGFLLVMDGPGVDAPDAMGAVIAEDIGASAVLAFPYWVEVPYWSPPDHPLQGPAEALPEVQCPGCGTTIRARMADAPVADHEATDGADLDPVGVTRVENARLRDQLKATEDRAEDAERSATHWRARAEEHAAENARLRDQVKAWRERAERAERAAEAQALARTGALETAEHAQVAGYAAENAKFRAESTILRDRTKEAQALAEQAQARVRAVESDLADAEAAVEARRKACVAAETAAEGWRVQAKRWEQAAHDALRGRQGLPAQRPSLNPDTAS